MFFLSNALREYSDFTIWPYGNTLFERALPSENPYSAFLRTDCCPVFSEEQSAFRVGLWTFFLKVIPLAVVDLLRTAKRSSSEKNFVQICLSNAVSFSFLTSQAVEIAYIISANRELSNAIGVV